jgi:hypothetical protein
MPAQAGIQPFWCWLDWVPAFAGTSEEQCDERIHGATPCGPSEAAYLTASMIFT